jgi:hypothetical protein
MSDKAYANHGGSPPLYISSIESTPDQQQPSIAWKEAPLPYTKKYNPVGLHKDYGKDHPRAIESVS